ncbi:prepilin-type N-terminal cleavage/methylation domain-containing protein [Gimesia sp.]|uniref:type II secretion system protein n=1 Tax=Gimesia sp. TaxID=2024833 RepID=UPI0032EAE429
MRRNITHQSVRSARSGFTIVELLVVIGILLFLIATSAFVVRNIGNKAREKKTMSTIVKVNGLMQDRIEAMRKALDSTKNQQQLQSLVGQKYTSLVNNYGAKYRSIPKPVVEILVRKDIFRQNLPQYVAENPSVNAAMDAQQGVASGAAGNLGADAGASISSEYLYYILTKHETYGVSPVGEDAFLASEVADTDGDGLMEFVDGWGKPLRFYRWPTRLIKPDGSTIRRDIASAFFNGLPPASAAGFNEADPMNVDADDPQGRIQHENNRSGDLLTPLFNSSADSQYVTGQYGVMNTFWLPLIVSAGQDGILGLQEPHDEVNTGVLAQPVIPIVEGVFDNITNHNQRAGGR